MRVERFFLRDQKQRLQVTAANSKQQWDQRDGVLCFAQVDGAVGVGEASPLPGYSPDTVTDVRTCLTHVCSLSAPPFTSAEGIFHWVDQVVPVQLPSARFALESALLDALGQWRGVPLWQLLPGGPVQAYPPKLAAVLAPGADLVQRAQAANTRGAHTIKLKVGVPGQLPQESAALAQLVAELPLLKLRLDANGNCSYPDAEALAAAAGVSLEFFEEPCPSAELILRRRTFSVALDESLQFRCFNADLAAWAFGPQGPRVFVLKPMSLGGFSRCIALWEHAQRSGIRCSLSHSFGGVVELAGAQQLAAVCQAPELAAGLADHAGLGGHIQSNQLQDVLTRPGLGLNDAVRQAW